jgi:uncharacterized protein (TIGR02118 family)
MIKVSILYPYRGNVRFDIDYYRDKHMPLAAKHVGGALKGAPQILADEVVTSV